jgi:hypothetical protein
MVGNSTRKSESLKNISHAKGTILFNRSNDNLTIIFLMNISYFEYIWNFSYIVSTCWEASHI